MKLLRTYVEEKLVRERAAIYVATDELEVPVMAARKDAESGRIYASIRVQDVAKGMLRGCGCPSQKRAEFFLADGSRVVLVARRYQARPRDLAVPQTLPREGEPGKRQKKSPPGDEPGGPGGNGPRGTGRRP